MQILWKLKRNKLSIKKLALQHLSVKFPTSSQTLCFPLLITVASNSCLQIAYLPSNPLPWYSENWWQCRLFLTIKLTVRKGCWQQEMGYRNCSLVSHVKKRGAHGVSLNTATLQKKLTNTASPQEKSTKHPHRNIFIRRNTFIPKQLTTK